MSERFKLFCAAEGESREGRSVGLCFPEQRLREAELGPRELMTEGFRKGRAVGLLGSHTEDQ